MLRNKKTLLPVGILTVLYLLLAVLVYFTEIVPRANEGYPFWNGWFLSGAIILYLMLILSYLAFFTFRLRIERVFLLVGTCLGILFNFLILPGSIPDEPDHIATAYYFSNKLLQIPDLEPYEDEDGELFEGIYVRQTDVEFMNRFQLTPTLKEYIYVRDFAKEKNVSDEPVEFGRTKYTENWTTYIPTILSTTLCRLLGVNGVVTIYVGRAVQTAIWLLVFYFAIRLLPIGKGVLFLLGIFPITIQQCISYSYDAAAIEASVLFFALLFRILYGGRQIGVRDTVLLGILLFILASCKGGVYIPECLFLLLIPKESYGSARARRLVRVILLLCILAGFLMNTFGYLLVVLGLRENPLSGATADYSVEIATYTVSDVLHEPLEAGYVLFNTLLMYADFYLEGAISGPLGWLTIGVNRVLSYVLLFLLLVAAVRTEQTDAQVTKKHRCWFALAAVLTFLMSAGAMLISWTDRNNNYITGLQGRYFTPILPYLAFLLRNEGITVQRNVDRELSYAGVLISVLIVWNILYSTRLATL